MTETAKAKRRVITHHVDVSKSAWASICAGVFYVSISESRSYSLAGALRYMLDKIESKQAFVDEQLISEFLDAAEPGKGVAITLGLPPDTNDMLGELHRRMQAVSDRRITRSQAIHFALALVPRPFW